MRRDLDPELFLKLAKERLTYAAKEGAFYRKNHTGVKEGTPFGTLRHGKHRAMLGGVYLQVDALVWLVETGNFPSSRLVHKNGDLADDRYSNLKEVGLKTARWRGEEFTHRELSEISGVNRSIVYYRLKHGLDPVYGKANSRC